MFEESKLIEIGNLENDPDGDGAIGIRLQTREGRIITVRGLTESECVAIANANDINSELFEYRRSEV